jgi:HlyD family secretion protein
MSRKFLIISFGLMFLIGCRRKSPEIIITAGVVDGDVITVKSPVAGKVEILNFDEGAGVTEDAVLMVVDSEKIENQIQGLDIQEREISVNRKKLERQINLLKATHEYWKEQVARFERLEEKESISGDQLKQARLKLDEVEASLFDTQQSLNSLFNQSANIQNQKERLRLVLEDHNITSPVSGIVLERFVSEGETIFPSTPVADILDGASLFVETFLEEQELSLLELGEHVDILVDGQEGRMFSGTIINFGQKAEFSPKYIISEKERRSLLYRVKIRLDGDLDVFKLGMPVTVWIAKS